MNNNSAINLGFGEGMAIAVVYGFATLLLVLAALVYRKDSRKFRLSIVMVVVAIGVILIGEAYLMEPLEEWFEDIPHSLR